VGEPGLIAAILQLCPPFWELFMLFVVGHNCKIDAGPGVHSQAPA
jgi:hypothetical protein